MPVDGSAVGTLCFVFINPSFLPSFLEARLACVLEERASRQQLPRLHCARRLPRGEQLLPTVHDAWARPPAWRVRTDRWESWRAARVYRIGADRKGDFFFPDSWDIFGDIKRRA